MTEEKVNRREFLQLNWESSIGFLGNFLVPQMEVERNFIRPPGACDELEFLASCTRCGKCQEVCPEQTVKLFPLSRGAKLMNTPYMDLNQSPCTFCGKCIEVCPTEALNSFDLKKNPSLGVVRVKKHQCLAYQQVMCDYCVRACHEQALKLENGVPLVSRELCTGCGICVSTCITETSSLEVVVK